MQTRYLIYENLTGYLKNRYTKHRLVCTHSEAFFMLILNIGMSISNFEFFEFFTKNYTSILISAWMALKGNHAPKSNAKTVCVDGIDD